MEVFLRGFEWERDKLWRRETEKRVYYKILAGAERRGGREGGGREIERLVLWTVKPFAAMVFV